MNYLISLLYIVSAFTPSLVWLFFYLSKDKHPEPQKAILTVFFLGIVVAAMVYLITLAIFCGIAYLYPELPLNNFWIQIVKYFFIVALIEELSKYLIVRRFIMVSPDVDEPLDIMLYLVISALGFAALENLLLVFTTILPISTTQIVYFSFLRFISATFLHTLTSGTLGFFLALSFYSAKHKKVLFFVGLGVAVFMHGLYDLAIIEFTGIEQTAMQAIILLTLAIFTTWGFVKLRNIKSARKAI